MSDDPIVQLKLETQRDMADLRHELLELINDFGQFKFYSMGIAVVNKPRTQSDLLVCPVEVFPLNAGELSAEEELHEDEWKDYYDIEYKVSTVTRRAIRCKHLSMSSNSVLAPDIRVGERVFIYRYADADEFYWVDPGLDAHLRRLETKLWLFSADPDGLSDAPRSAENSYMLELSTHDKLITFKTTNLNSEPFVYTFQLNTENGHFTITDDVGNYVMLDSQETSIEFENSDKTHVKLTKKNISVYAPNNIDIVADNDISIKCKNLTQTIGGNYTTKVTGSTTIQSNGYTLKSPTVDFTCTFSLTGNVTLTGNMTCSGMIQCMQLTSTLPISAPNV